MPVFLAGKRPRDEVADQVGGEDRAGGEGLHHPLRPSKLGHRKSGWPPRACAVHDDFPTIAMPADEDRAEAHRLVLHVRIAIPEAHASVVQYSGSGESTTELHRGNTLPAAPGGAREPRTSLPAWRLDVNWHRWRTRRERTLPTSARITYGCLQEGRGASESNAMAQGRALRRGAPVPWSTWRRRVRGRGFHLGKVPRGWRFGAVWMSTRSSKMTFARTRGCVAAWAARNGSSTRVPRDDDDFD